MPDVMFFAILSTLSIAAAAIYSVRKFDAAPLPHRAAMTLFPASQIAAALFVFSAMHRAGIGTALAPVVFIVCVGCTVADVALCSAIAKAGRRSSDVDRRRLLEEQEQAEAGYRDRIAQMEERALAARDSLLSSVDTMIETLDAGQAADVGEMADRAAQTVASHVAGVCENRAVDALLGEKLADARKAGITANVDVVAPEGLPFATTDLCALFANLMDNAIAASVEANEKVLSLKARLRGVFYVVEMRNSCIPGTEAPGRGEKAKPGYAHGWGLQILEDIARRHGGVCDALKEGDVFVTTVMLSTLDLE